MSGGRRSRRDPGAWQRNRTHAQRARVLTGRARMSAARALARPDVSLDDLRVQGFELEAAPGTRHLDEATVTAELKYGGYLKRQAARLVRLKRDEQRVIPGDFVYAGIPGLSREVVERLTEVRPSTIAQAGRVPGVTAAAVAILAARLTHPVRPST